MRETDKIINNTRYIESQKDLSVDNERILKIKGGK